MKPAAFLRATLLSIVSAFALHEGRAVERQSASVLTDEDIWPECHMYVDSGNDTVCNLRLRIADDVGGSFALDPLAFHYDGQRITAVASDTVLVLDPVVDPNGRICDLVSDFPLRKGCGFRIHIPAGIIKVMPEKVEVEELDIDEELLTSLSVAGGWHRRGEAWTRTGMYSVIDDDSLDGQIPSSKHSVYTYGYYSLLYPLLESLGLKGNLAVEGRKIGIDCDPPYLNDNGKTLIRLQDEKGWSLLCHSMDCLGEEDNNWIVDSLDSRLAQNILRQGPNYGASARTVSVYDMKTRRQYWPNSDNSEWVESPSRYVKPYAGSYRSGRNVMYNPDFDIDWHWGEWKRRAEAAGINAVGFVTHNSTSSHALVPEIRKVFPNGFSDIGAVNINYPPMLSSGVRSGLEGQSMAGYDGNSKDNTFDKDHYKAYCSQIDEAFRHGGWIVFNLHAYRDCWRNSLPGKLVSEGGSYPDEWVIPMKGMDSARDPLTPPAHLGISEWSEWYPCPGTRLEMMWMVLKYARDKGMLNVTCREGFEIMGNRTSSGYYNDGYRFGMDIAGLVDTEEVYPHYVVSANGEMSYFNSLRLGEMSMDLDDWPFRSEFKPYASGRFLIIGNRIVWNGDDLSGISLNVYDSTGKMTEASDSNSIMLSGRSAGVLIVCAVRGRTVVGTMKIIR